ncbi:MAG TPA: glycosyltransferase [Mucilaginibacter sp.]|jgi:glycosyltransferase involved in cell wall biosynthesis|nr:glycosyltransferase [Mucilaginibacter sp.]
MKEELVSVALCTYNGEKYIEEQLQSIINQTYGNLEITVVDDCSTDGTARIIREFANRDKRIQFFINSHNLGFNKNFEKALRLTSGKFIAISDQDDIWLPDKLALLRQNIGDNWLIFSNSGYVGDMADGELLPGFKLPGSYKGILLHNYVTGHTSMLTRELLQASLPIPEKGYYDWWLGFIAAYRQKIFYLPVILTLHRIHEESIMQKLSAEQNAEWKAYENTAEMLNNFAGYHSLAPEDKNFITQLSHTYQLKGSGSLSVPLMKIIIKYYPELFPNVRPRTMFSKVNFARKYAEGVKNDA